MLTIETEKKDKKLTLKISPGTTNVVNRNELSTDDFLNKINRTSIGNCEMVSLKFEKGIKILDGKYIFDQLLPVFDTFFEIDLENVDMSSVKDVSGMFRHLYMLKEVKLPEMENVVNTSEMFYDCRSLEEIDVSKVGGNNIIVSSKMFNGCSELKSVKLSKALSRPSSNREVPFPNGFFSGCKNLNILDLIEKEDEKEEFLKKLSLNDYYLYQEYKGERKNKDILSGIRLNSLNTNPDIIWSLVDRGIGDKIVKMVTESENEKRTLDIIPKEYLLAGSKEELKIISETDLSEIKNNENKVIYWLNIKNYAKQNNISLKDAVKEAPVFDFPDLNIEELLEKLKNRELKACYTEFGEKKLKKTQVLFLSNDGYIVAEKRLKDLDERFRRFIKGLYLLDGKIKNFVDYITDMRKEKFIISEPDSLPYVFAQTFLYGWTPDNDFLQELNKRFFNPKTGRVDIPDIKGIWKLYNTSKCWNKNIDSTSAYFNVLKVFGILERDEKIRNEGINLFYSLTNYIPDSIEMDGYTYAKEFNTVKQEINIRSEINIKPGIPYDAKKAKNIIFSELSEDPGIMSIAGDKDNLKKILKNIYPLAELMDARSIYEMPDGKAKDFMLRVMDILYVSTEDIKVDINKNNFSGEEGKNNLKDFRKFTEKYADDSDIKSHVLTSVAVHALFGGLDNKFNPDFTQFIKNHQNEILNCDNPWKMGGKLSAIQKNWDYIQLKKEVIKRDFKDKAPYKMSFNEIERILQSFSYNRDDFYDHKYDEIEELCKLNCYGQDMFEKCCTLYDKMCERNGSSIPDVEGEVDGYTYKMLALDDPGAIFFGQMLDNCQQFGNAGEDCMIHSCSSENGRVFGVFNEQGIMVAGSWVWRNGDTVCFDNIEAANNPDIANIVNVYEEAALKIPENTVEEDTINKVTFGKGYSDISYHGFEEDTVNKYPIERQEISYLNDSRQQYILYNSGEEKEVETVSHYEKKDIEHINSVISCNYDSTLGRRNREIFRFEDYELQEPDEEEWEEEHDSKVIDYDIDDCEIIDRVLEEFNERNLEEERD